MRGREERHGVRTPHDLGLRGPSTARMKCDFTLCNRSRRRSWWHTDGAA